MNYHHKSGISILEVMLASAIFAIFATPALGVILQGFSTSRSAAEHTVATHFASEGLEAVRSIRNRSFANLVNTGGTGVVRNASGVWEFSGSSNTFFSQKTYTRVIEIADVMRDGSGAIVDSGGVVDPTTKKATSTVTWNFNPGRPLSVVVADYLSSWNSTLPPQRRGMLVYGDGGLSTDAMRYRLLDEFGVWGASQSMADIDASTTNRALRAVRLYASTTRNEKIALSRHHNGSTQYIYAQVFNGSTWGNVVLLSSWNSNTLLDVRNFDGAYLQNGHFMVSYSDNTNIPKVRVWNGISWGGQINTQNVGGVPTYIALRRRPGTNEAMMAVFNQSRRTVTQYFYIGANGTYETADWTLHSNHATQAPDTTRELVDFSWSPNTPTIGALVYSNANNDNRMNIKIFTANGSGGGSWGGSAPDAPAHAAGSARLVAVSVDGRPNANEFVACATDTGRAIRCYESTFAPAWVTPTNYTIETNTDSGNQRSFQVSFEATFGFTAVVVFSDDTETPKLKRYDPVSNVWDSDAEETSISPLSTVLKTVRMAAQSDSDDIMILMGDANLNMYTTEWNGETNSLYTTPVYPAGKDLTPHGTNGSAVTDMWYDFEWDRH